jgi:hypothetical protein
MRLEYLPTVAFGVRLEGPACWHGVLFCSVNNTLDILHEV